MPGASVRGSMAYSASGGTFSGSWSTGQMVVEGVGAQSTKFMLSVKLCCTLEG